MRTLGIRTLLAIGFVGLTASTPGRATDTTLEAMPPKLETQFALSAAPPALRDQATVYLLDPKHGYRAAREGTSGVTCIVERTSWDLADFRNDIYFPLCYDAAGTKTYLKHIMDAAALRAQGMGPAALKAEIERRYRDKVYQVPERPGVSYMLGPLMRTIGPPDLQVRTMTMPHLMFYAPYLTNEDIGARPDLKVRSTLLYPFIDKQGSVEHSYMIQLIGAAEKAAILADEKALVDALCAYRDVLCLEHEQTNAAH